MNCVSILSLPAVNMLVMSILFQIGLGNLPPDTRDDPFVRATTPPGNFNEFNEDFSSLDMERFLKWINPSLGLVKNGVLLMADEVEEVFMSTFESEGGKLVDLNLHFNYGEFGGANTYHADCWVEYKLKEDGAENWYRFHNVFVFEIIDGRWYLVQSEYIAPRSGVVFDLEWGNPDTENMPEELSHFMNQYSEPTLAGSISWPLLIGSNFVSEGQLHPVKAKKMNGADWTLRQAVKLDKPVVLYFFSVHALLFMSGAEPENFDKQMEFLSGLYDTFGKDNLFIFGVTDDPREDVEWLGESGYTSFAPLLDEGSSMHAALNIDMHPYIVVFDSRGTVVGISKTWHPSSLDLVESRIREVLAKVEASS